MVVDLMYDMAKLAIAAYFSPPFVTQQLELFLMENVQELIHIVFSEE